MQGKVLEVVPYELIRYSILAPASGLEDKPDNYAIMTYTLEDHGDATTVTIGLEDHHSRLSDQHTFAENWGAFWPYSKSLSKPSNSRYVQYQSINIFRI